MSNPDRLPHGFRFHPTDEELIVHYLRNRAAAAPCPVAIIADVDIYKFDPWDLPCKAMYGDKEWYFFSPRDRKYPNGLRPNRAALTGYWKATGTDKPILDSASGATIGVKKALVFYKGRPPKGVKTNWIMHEYRLADAAASSNVYRPMRFQNHCMRLDDWVLCRIYKKGPAGSQSLSPAPPGSAGTSTGQQHPLPPAAAAISPFLDDCAVFSQLFADIPSGGVPQHAGGGGSGLPAFIGYVPANSSAAAGSGGDLHGLLCQAQAHAWLGSSTGSDEP